MWFDTDRVRQALASISTKQTTDPAELSLMEKRRQAEKKIMEVGKAVCLYCNETIYHRPEMAAAGWTWESENLFGWCENSRGNKHQPRIVVEDEDA